MAQQLARTATGTKVVTYQQWMARVDAACWTIAGCSTQDLTDFCYHDAYEDGESPVRAARAAIRNQEE